MFPNAIETEEVYALSLLTSNQIVNTFSPLALMTIVKSKVTRFFPVLPLRSTSCLYHLYILYFLTEMEGTLPPLGGALELKSALS
jgi:membrane-bound metal-dependent hydrolase YbcI (DUF457 family)